MIVQDFVCINTLSLLKRIIIQNIGTRRMLLLQTIQELKNKDYGQEQDEEECGESDASDEGGLSIYAFAFAGDNSFRNYRAMYGDAGADT